jgi:hypothetical protein
MVVRVKHWPFMACIKWIREDREWPRHELSFREQDAHSHEDQGSFSVDKVVQKASTDQEPHKVFTFINIIHDLTPITSSTASTEGRR